MLTRVDYSFGVSTACWPHPPPAVRAAPSKNLHQAGRFLEFQIPARIVFLVGRVAAVSTSGGPPAGKAPQPCFSEVIALETAHLSAATERITLRAELKDQPGKPLRTVSE